MKMTPPFNAAVQGLRAWVVFTGQADLPWLKIFRPGFRHCFLVMHDGCRWLSFDPMLNHIDLRVHDHLPAGFDLPCWLRGRGHVVVSAPVDRSRSNARPLALFTCVEAVKRVLGLRAALIMTPWQLYRHLVSKTHRDDQSKGDIHG